MILWLLIIIICLGIGAYLLVEFKLKKWKCREGKCEKVFGGDYSTKEECANKCSMKQDYKSDKDRRLIESRRERVKRPKKSVSWKDKLTEYLN